MKLSNEGPVSIKTSPTNWCHGQEIRLKEGNLFQLTYGNTRLQGIINVFAVPCQEIQLKEGNLIIIHYCINQHTK